MSLQNSTGVEEVRRFPGSREPRDAGRWSGLSFRGLGTHTSLGTLLMPVGPIPFRTSSDLLIWNGSEQTTMAAL